MALVSISEASRLTNKSRRTLHNYISQGKLSKKIDVKGKPKIDTSELLRVFGGIDIVQNSHTPKCENSQYFTHINVQILHEKDLELVKLRKEVELLHQLIEEKDKHNNDLKQSILLLENTIFPVKKKWWKFFK